MIYDKSQVTVARKGRPKGALNKRSIFAREWAEKLGLQDPAEFLIRVLNSDTIEVTKADADGGAVLDAEGKPVKLLAVVPLDTRILCARELLGYVYPKLSAQQMQTTVDVDASMSALPIDAILKSPELTAALTDLALLVAEQETSEATRPYLAPVLVDAMIRD
jgi:hypothetical protein